MEQLHLEKVTYLNWDDVEELRVAREQKHFIADNVGSLAYAGLVREAGFQVFTFGIYKGEKPVGFTMIGYDIPYDPDDDLSEKILVHKEQLLYLALHDRHYGEDASLTNHLL